MTASTLVRAGDLMQRDVVSLRANTPIREAIETLEDYRISGAPVVDAVDQLVGVLSASDIIKSEHVEEERSGLALRGYHSVDPFWDDSSDSWLDGYEFDSADYSQALLERETVGDWMTPNVFSVTPEATLQEVCALIDKERIHRVFVAKEKQLVGVISTIDIVSYIAQN